MFEGTTIVPSRLGGVKMPSSRSPRVSVWHAVSGERPSHACGLNGGSDENGCVGHARSPGTVLAGTGRSSTGKIGAPVSRLSTNIIPVLVVWITAGWPFTVASNGGDALS